MYLKRALVPDEPITTNDRTLASTAQANFIILFGEVGGILVFKCPEAIDVYILLRDFHEHDFNTPEFRGFTVSMATVRGWLNNTCEKYG